MEEAAGAADAGGSYGFCWGDSKIVRFWECKSRVVSEDSLACGPEQRASGRGLEIGAGGLARAVTVDRDTKGVGVDDSVRARGMGDRLGRVKSNPWV